METTVLIWKKNEILLFANHHGHIGKINGKPNNFLNHYVTNIQKKGRKHTENWKCKFQHRSLSQCATVKSENNGTKILRATSTTKWQKIVKFSLKKICNGNFCIYLTDNSIVHLIQSMWANINQSTSIWIEIKTFRIRTSHLSYEEKGFQQNFNTINCFT